MGNFNFAEVWCGGGAIPNGGGQLPPFPYGSYSPASNAVTNRVLNPLLYY